MSLYANDLPPVTREEFEAQSKDELLDCELIDGVVFMSPRPSKTHQRISKRLTRLLDDCLTAPCEALPEIDLILADNIFIPDLQVICAEEQEERAQTTPPLIVLEILSPSSASRDHFTKRYQYEALGIKEYWIISPEEKCVTLHNFTTDTHQIYAAGTVQSIILPEIKIALADIF